MLPPQIVAAAGAIADGRAEPAMHIPRQTARFVFTLLNSPPPANLPSLKSALSLLVMA